MVSFLRKLNISTIHYKMRGTNPANHVQTNLHSTIAFATQFAEIEDKKIKRY